MINAGPSFDKIGEVLAEIFHCTETVTKVAGTNVAKTNIPKTVADSCRWP